MYQLATLCLQMGKTFGDLFKSEGMKITGTDAKMVILDKHELYNIYTCRLILTNLE